MTEPTTEASRPIIVEFSQQPGVEQVNLLDLSREELEEKSKQALNAALNAIQYMAQRVSGLCDAIPVEFSEADIEFGVKLDWEAGVLLAKAGSEGSIGVTLKWERKEQKDE